MGKVPVIYVFAAIVPAIMIAGLYFFDHGVASQMAQQKEYNLKNPSSYHYDVFVLGIMVLKVLLHFPSFSHLQTIYFCQHYIGSGNRTKFLFITYMFQTLCCGLLGMPPSNGVIPQSPMHTKSLATLKRQVGHEINEWGI